MDIGKLLRGQRDHRRQQDLTLVGVNVFLAEEALVIEVGDRLCHPDAQNVGFHLIHQKFRQIASLGGGGHGVGGFAVGHHPVIQLPVRAIEDVRQRLFVPGIFALGREDMLHGFQGALPVLQEDAVGLLLFLADPDLLAILALHHQQVEGLVGVGGGVEPLIAARDAAAHVQQQGVDLVIDDAVGPVPLHARDEGERVGDAVSILGGLGNFQPVRKLGGGGAEALEGIRLPALGEVSGYGEAAVVRVRGGI